MKNQKLVGIFANEREAVKVIKNLKGMGYTGDDISVIAKNSCSLDRIDATGTRDPLPVEEEEDTLGGVVGHQFIAIPGTEAFSARGPVVKTFADMNAHGDLDRIARALVGIGIDKDDAEKYMSYIDRCDVIVVAEEKSELEKNRVLKYYKDNNSLV